MVTIIQIYRNLLEDNCIVYNRLEKC
jgi:hypothetical protein